jgi:NADH dehydrogenase FAD-containing subunit
MDVLESISYPGVSEEEKKKLLNFVIVGGGPTGVEFAAELKDFMNAEISKYFSHLKDDVKITIVQSGDHILNCYDEKISEFAEKKFKRDGIEILTNCRVIEVLENQVKLLNKGTKQTQVIPFGMCVWVTGITQVPLVRKLCAKLKSQNNRVGKC